MRIFKDKSADTYKHLFSDRHMISFKNSVFRYFYEICISFPAKNGIKYKFPLVFVDKVEIFKQKGAFGQNRLFRYRLFGKF